MERMHVFVHKCENENLYVGLTLCCVCDREQRESVMCVYGCMKECVCVRVFACVRDSVVVSLVLRNYIRYQKYLKHVKIL